MVSARRWAVALLLLVTLPARPSPVHAQSTRLVDVPAGLRAPAKERLTNLRAALSSRIDHLNEGIDALNRRCRSIRDRDIALRQECLSTQRRLTSTQDRLLQDVTSFRDAVVESIRTEQNVCRAALATSRGKIAEAQKNLSRYVGSDVGRRMDEWARLPSAARSEARAAALDAAMSLTLDGLTEKNRATRGIKDPDAAEVREVLKKYGSYFDKYVPGTSTDVTALGQDAWVLDKVGDIRVAMAHSENLLTDKDASEKALTGAAILLGTAVTNPTAKLVLTNIDIWVPLVFYGVAVHEATERVHQLDELTELDLRAVESLSKFVVAETGRSSELSARCEDLSKAQLRLN